MLCIKAEIPKEICEIDDELKAIYHSYDTICIWVFKSREDRNNFMNATACCGVHKIISILTRFKNPNANGVIRVINSF